MSGEPWTDALEAELTFPKILARSRYWRENPPATCLLLAVAIGLGVWKPERRAADDPTAALRRLFPSGRL